ncbi:PREDICTED: aldo-keto reductase AKR2E4-like [Papilio xuthus]|uniref:Aldo-keto reductase AKR2E4-like n=1 Tax=Papilio xuthus TaxID=66420 RepID=A0AAJ6ZA16_PAPXU|nr:PREDICTED: aldo-keto reductase AKR2E4-like [Papilio xuthus]
MLVLRLAVLFLTCNALTWALQAPVTLLNDGNKMPILALGTAGSKDDISRMRQAVYWAIEAGYRHIDTAELYRDEEEVGLGIADAIKKGLVTREELFVTTKLWNNHHARSAVIPALQESLKRLGLNYVDLYLVHSPIAVKDDGTAEDIDYLETWRGMEDAKKRGLAKSIGVSNFNSEQIARIIKGCEFKPAVNQIEVNPTLSQEPLVAYCRSVEVAVMSYSPFGFMVSRRKQDSSPPRFDDPELTKIAQKYGKNTSQIVLRYLIDRGTTPIPKSTNKDRIIQNIDIFDFSLTDEDIATIKKFNKNTRVLDLIEWKDHAYYPFNKP